MSWLFALFVGAMGMYAAGKKTVSDYQRGIIAAETQRELEATQRKLAEEKAANVALELAARSNDDEALFALRESADHGFMELDSMGRVIKWNAALQNWTGYTFDEMKGLTLEKVMAPEDYVMHSASYPAWIKAEDTAIKTLKLDCKLITKTGKKVSVIVTARKVRPVEGRPGDDTKAIGLVDRPRNVMDLTEQ